MSYEFYKVLHILSILVFFSASSYLLLSGQRLRKWQILTGVASFFILLAGMGLVAKTKSGFPGWVVAKLVIWLFVTAIGHVVAKRFSHKGAIAYWVTMVMAFMAIYLAVNKPGIGS